VPNATVMVILDADRFGIAQLHQLRGRVGRGSHASVCWLVTAPAGRRWVGNPRVEALVASTDGFLLAEVDLELRGEGTIMSTAQKGRNDLKLASLRRDRELVTLAPRCSIRDRRLRPLLDDIPYFSTSCACCSARKRRSSSSRAEVTRRGFSDPERRRAHRRTGWRG
jgi:ATP-dependent DNA helicase RecG